MGRLGTVFFWNYWQTWVALGKGRIMRLLGKGGPGWGLILLLARVATPWLVFDFDISQGSLALAGPRFFREPG